MNTYIFILSIYLFSLKINSPENDPIDNWSEENAHEEAKLV